MDSSDSAHSTTARPIGDVLKALKDAIWERRPILAEIMQKHGNKNLFEYAKDFMDVNPSPLLDGRKEELISVFQDILASRLGNTIAESAAAQLRKHPLVSTTDHHGPIQHPFFLNANIISALPYKEFTDHSLDYLIVFSFASVSLNNASAFSRGVMFHGGMNGSGNMIRVPLLPDKLKMAVVHATRSYTREEVQKAKQYMQDKFHKQELSLPRMERMSAVLDTVFASEDILAMPDFNSQITALTYRIWPQFFHPAHPGETYQEHVPDLLYVEIETLVSEVLIQYHFFEASSLIHKLMFDPAYQKLCTKHFNNLPGAFSIEQEWGSYLFWGLDDKQHRVRLKFENNTFTSFGGTIRVDCTPEGLTEALRTKKIFPGMFLCYLLVSLYYGMKCLGGFCQVNDLTMTKRAWIDLLQEVGLQDEAEAVVPVQTKELGGDGLVLSYLHTIHNELVPATGFDMLMDEGDTSFDGYIELSKRVTLSEMMLPMLPEIYTVISPPGDRDPDLASVRPEHIYRETGLQQKLLED